MTGIALVADKNTATCFKLAGLEDVHAIKDAKEAEKCLNALFEKKNLAVVLVTERILNQIQNGLMKITEHKYPLIIPIPDIKGPEKMEIDPIVKLIKAKTGIEVKLR